VVDDGDGGDADMLHALRERIVRLVSMGTSTTTQPSAAARSGRAREVADLQLHVSRIQAAIADLCRSESGLAGNAPPNEARLSELQDELDKTQRELARFQGRI
jgi:hypothetical protein